MINLYIDLLNKGYVFSYTKNILYATQSYFVNSSICKKIQNLSIWQRITTVIKPVSKNEMFNELLEEIEKSKHEIAKMEINDEYYPHARKLFHDDLLAFEKHILKSLEIDDLCTENLQKNKQKLLKMRETMYFVVQSDDHMVLCYDERVPLSNPEGTMCEMNTYLQFISHTNQLDYFLYRYIDTTPIDLTLFNTDLDKRNAEFLWKERVQASQFQNILLNFFHEVRNPRNYISTLKIDQHGNHYDNQDIGKLFYYVFPLQHLTSYTLNPSDPQTIAPFLHKNSKMFRWGGNWHFRFLIENSSGGIDLIDDSYIQTNYFSSKQKMIEYFNDKEIYKQYQLSMFLASDKAFLTDNEKKHYKDREFYATNIAPTDD